MPKTTRSESSSSQSNNDEQHHEQTDSAAVSSLKKHKAAVNESHESALTNGSSSSNGHHANGNGHHAKPADASSSSSSTSTETKYMNPDDGDAVNENTTINGTTRPADWPPATGAIDLNIHDLPHSSSDTEWWYVHAHLKTSKGRDFSIFSSFFRIVRDYDRVKQQYNHLHALTWAVIDVENQRYLCEPALDSSTPSVLKRQIEDGEFHNDKRLQRALHEIVSRGNVPKPDRLLGDVKVALDKLDLDYDHGHRFYKQADGSYMVEDQSRDGSYGYKLKFVPKRQAIRHGYGGVVKIGVKGDDMFYYFVPRCEVSGELWVDGQKETVQGSGWYDHEFGGLITAPRNDEEQKRRDAEKKEKVRSDYGWNWLAVQLDDGTDITATTVVKPAPPKSGQPPTVLDNFAILVSPDSQKKLYQDSDLRGVKDWFSCKTSHDYPTTWKLSIPRAEVDLTITAAFPNQELISVIARPAFWEGRMHVEGTIRGKPVTGRAFVERHGFQDGSMDSFFKKISKLVRHEIEKVLPLNPTHDQYLNMISSPGFENYLDGASLEVFRDTVVRPLREVIDRGGKAWRSYCLLLCIDAVGGDSSKFVPALAMPEIMHCGSLIIDDIQDKSDFRRGGPTCHKIHGEAVAINSGTAGYFLSVSYLRQILKGLTDTEWVDIYDSYFLTLRAAHAGQAFDINGVDHLVQQAIESGENKQLCAAISCTHRLKSAVPASNLARIGVLLGKGSKAQMKAVNDYFEAVGIAFQIIDDVLNLRGMPGKTKGEDLTAGKVTFPVAMSLTNSRLNKQQRQDLIQSIQAKPSDPAVVEKLVQTIEDCGGLQAANDEAFRLVESAWTVLEKLLEDSFYKVNLRAFGWYVLERHY